MSQFIIRPINLNDIKSIEQLIWQLSDSIEQESILDNIKRYVDNLDYEAMVAINTNGLIVGLIAMHSATFLHRKNNIARIMGLVVDSNHRRHGIGKILMEQAEKWAIKNECDIIELTSGIARKNSGTHDFYDKLGYKNINENKKIYLRKNILVF